VIIVNYTLSLLLSMCGQRVLGIHFYSAYALYFSNTQKNQVYVLVNATSWSASPTLHPQDSTTCSLFMASACSSYFDLSQKRVVYEWFSGRSWGKQLH